MREEIKICEPFTIHNYRNTLTEEVFIKRGDIRNEAKHRATCLKNKLKRKNKKRK